MAMRANVTGATAEAQEFWKTLGSTAFCYSKVCGRGGRATTPDGAFFADSDLSPGWRARVPIYQLWPMLVHLRLFGDGYRGRVESLLRECGA